MNQNLLAIQATHLKKRFGDLTAVDGIDLTIPQGSITAILGGNGAGKTTTISMLLGLLLPTSGTISILGIDMLKNRHKILPKMNFASPYTDLPGRLSVKQNLTVYGHLYGIPRAQERIEEVAEELQLTDMLSRSYGSLSAGQKTRASLAKAILNKPKVLLLDEPTASLDPDVADWVRTLLLNFQEQTGATIFMASHNMLEVERLCHSVIVMKKGRIVDQASPKKLIESYGRSTLEEVFLDIARDQKNAR